MTTRRDFLAASAAALPAVRGRTALWLADRRPLPTPAQLAWQRDELALFLHFGVNTFTDREWGEGTESPGIFAPTALDAGQWARAARNAGFRAMVLTAKHHDGFCLWPTSTTRHSVASSAYTIRSRDWVTGAVEQKKPPHANAVSGRRPNASATANQTPERFMPKSLAEMDMREKIGPMAKKKRPDVRIPLEPPFDVTVPKKKKPKKKK